MSLWFAILCPLEVSIQNLTQGCPVPPIYPSEPDKEGPRRQDDKANDVSVEEDNGGENSGGCGGQKGNHCAAPQEESPQYFISASHSIRGSLDTTERTGSPTPGQWCSICQPRRDPGIAVCIVAVSAQHRGRVFLAFADGDPRTAEIVAKVVLLARDDKIKDPTILQQLVR